MFFEENSINKNNMNNNNNNKSLLQRTAGMSQGLIIGMSRGPLTQARE